MVIDERGLEIIARRLAGKTSYDEIGAIFGIGGTRASQIGVKTFRQLALMASRRRMGEPQIPDVQIVNTGSIEATGPSPLYRRYVPYFDQLRPQLETLKGSEVVGFKPNTALFGTGKDGFRFALLAFTSYLRAYFPGLSPRWNEENRVLRAGIRNRR